MRSKEAKREVVCAGNDVKSAGLCTKEVGRCVRLGVQEPRGLYLQRERGFNRGVVCSRK